MLQRRADAGLGKGHTIGIDATTLEAKAALRSIVRRDTAETYQEFLTQLADASRIATPTREDLARLDRHRKKKGSDDDWTHPHDKGLSISAGGRRGVRRQREPCLAEITELTRYHHGESERPR